MKCKQCNREHNRKKFCSDLCKDRYHNIHNPRGYGIQYHESEGIEDIAGPSYAAGWDEDGWRSDDSGVTSI